MEITYKPCGVCGDNDWEAKEYSEISMLIECGNCGNIDVIYKNEKGANKSMSEQMTIQDLKKIIHEEMEKAGIKVPVEEKFDYSCIQGEENVRKTREFIRLCDGKLCNTTYVSKPGARDGDYHYFDLLFVVNEKGYPICLPVPLARKLFNVGMIQSPDCRSVIQGTLYEYIYKLYYEWKRGLPF
jgi:hypothetical protein